MKTLFLAVFLMSVSLFAGDTNNIIPNGVAVASVPNCKGGPEAEGIATYSRTLTNGWGYSVDTNGNTVFKATYTNSTRVNIQAYGKRGDVYCSTSNSITIPNPPFSPKYRFTLFFADAADVPASTNLCPLQVVNILP